VGGWVVGLVVGRLRLCRVLWEWLAQPPGCPPHRVCLNRHFASCLQMGHKEREAEFWRIVEDGEDVVEVRRYRLPVLHRTACLCYAAQYCVERRWQRNNLWALSQASTVDSALVLHFLTLCCICGFSWQVLYGADLDSTEVGSGFPRAPPLGDRYARPLCFPQPQQPLLVVLRMQWVCCRLQPAARRSQPRPLLPDSSRLTSITPACVLPCPPVLQRQPLCHRPLEPVCAAAPGRPALLPAAGAGWKHYRWVGGRRLGG
jgi:hypothetical protein